MKITVNSLNYNIKVEGQGPSLVLLHGFTGDISTWEACSSLWSKHFQVISIDLIGHGKTESPEDADRYSMTDTIADLKAIIDKLGCEKIYLLGYSMGGRLALSFACKYPERMHSLILESSSPGLKTQVEQKERTKADSALADFILKNGVSAFMDKWESIPLFSSQKTLPMEKRIVIRNQRLMNNPIGLANSLRGIGTGTQPALWDRLELLDLPVILIVGELDRKFCRIAEEMALLLPDAKKVVVKQAGHAIHVEYPNFFGKIVWDWLLQIRN
jgi:2-succinyl-6-hydroxy-2,4-cyclohexadiene-1-carboxylate synthase